MRLRWITKKVIIFLKIKNVEFGYSDFKKDPSVKSVWKHTKLEVGTDF